jgi:hypothetical protein
MAYGKRVREKENQGKCKELQGYSIKLQIASDLFIKAGITKDAGNAIQKRSLRCKQIIAV